MHIVQEIVEKNKAGYRAGIWSCCSGSPDVIRATLRRAQATRTPALIESTSNQVNQEGGYTGMQPKDFAALVYSLASEMGVRRDNIILAGDHLGPLPWTHLDAEEAMDKAEKLVVSCIMAGYSKIHLDTSMRVASDDPNAPFPVKVCAERGVRLCAACERAFDTYRIEHPDAVEPVYIIGSEVPVPGGECSGMIMGVTAPNDALKTIEIYREEFERVGCGKAFERVVGLVVEMGVEFHEFSLDEYDRRRTVGVVQAMRNVPLCIEGHSSDYQTEENLTRMCEDGVAILKVGPALTFSQREAMFALEEIERIVYAETPEILSDYRATLEEVMLENPKHWQSYYKGSEHEQRIARTYSFLDRCRYYLADKRVVAARAKLLENLSHNVIPLCILSQFMPTQYFKVRSGELRNEPLDLLLDAIGTRIDCYLSATNYCGMGRPRRAGDIR
ncbi:MAG: class II D-tagatose-bisphosphate aldolase, non-catalytic subunit [Coriobacteriales bacterium]|nr:class II D-tagatose-bisphosphate aldolase, non-catalytic subunit [Coriobacteriales bacterium]